MAFVTSASGFDSDQDVVAIRGDARLSAAALNDGQSAGYEITKGRKAYLVVASGKIDVNGMVVGQVTVLPQKMKAFFM